MSKAKIYIASSWKNEAYVLAFAKMIASGGYDYYCFAERGKGQHIFMWGDVVTPLDDGITCLDTDRSRQAYNVDKQHLDWCNTLILINPCGRDAHLEAGYVKGKGGLLYIVGDFPPGEYSNMYHIADALFRRCDWGYGALITRLDRIKLCRLCGAAWDDDVFSEICGTCADDIRGEHGE